jgi:hypothetical protein
MRHVPYFLGFSLGIVALGCSSSATDTTTIARPELVAVSPDDFLGELRCGEGHILSYVATLFDVTPGSDGSVPEPGFQLPSSPPTSCLLPVTFSDVITDHRYLAQVDVYTYPAQADLADAGSAGAGSADAGSADAGSADAGSADAGSADAGSADAGSAVAGSADAGSADAGSADAGSADAGSADAGSADAGSADAGSPYLVPSAPGARLQLDQAGARVAPSSTVTCGDYPPTFVDGGSYGSSGGAGAISYGEAGAAGAAEGLQSLQAYDGITQTAHDCQPGPPVRK